jgi:hypothetical protein
MTDSATVVRTIWSRQTSRKLIMQAQPRTSVAEPHHFYAAPAPGKIIDVAPAPILPYSKATVLKRTKV